ncbi:P-loop containing nucleoside triphosphate hydrolase protein [Sporormia fimetaria CBS 119925]|uniref:DNA 3'-5' helicase n=1 Tax=Sporormia fimetaria CBS 119925 TaxID=1340428 RepID=A0A6A6UW01_9PLEO|nr:P-loop containing nucleoside triphosphate hydrolase protein [Sporormia fimetaria CBS 119925]
MLEDVFAGRQRVIVATSALGMGVDIPDIRCIVHIDWPFSMLDYAQESGRAGRDGMRSEAVMIAQEGDQRPANDEQTEIEQALVRLYVEGANRILQCRRVVLDGFLDRRIRERVGCEEGEEKCDVCRGSREEMEEEDSEEDSEEEADTIDEEQSEEEAERKGEGETEGDCEEEMEGESEEEIERIEAEWNERKRIFEQQQRERQAPRQTFIQHKQQEFTDVEWLRRQLAWWTNQCALCEAIQNGQSGHDIRNCWRQESRAIQEEIQRVEREMKFERFSGCFWCGVPQEVCNRWEPSENGRYQRVRGQECQYTGVLIAAVVGISLSYKEVVSTRVSRVSHYE